MLSARNQVSGLSSASFKPSDYEATLGVTVDSNGYYCIEEIKPQEAASGLRNRRERKERRHEQEKLSTDDSIYWFSSLPPSDLRKTQKEFSTALKYLIEMASTVREIHDFNLYKLSDSTDK